MPRIGEIAERPDLRMPLLGLAAWVGALVAHAGARRAGLAGWRGRGCVVAGVVLVRRRGRAALATVAAVLLVGGAVAGATWLRAETVHALAGRGPGPGARGGQRDGPGGVRPADGRGPLRASRWWCGSTSAAVTGRGSHAEPARAGAGDRRRRVARRTAGRRRDARPGGSAPADDDDLAGVLVAAGDPDLVAGPGRLVAGGRARCGSRSATRWRAGPIEQRALVPALVDGDDAELPEGLERGLPDHRAHPPDRGVRHQPHPGGRVPPGRGPVVRGAPPVALLVGAVGIAGFVLLARTEPSVLRAAVMGAVGLLAMGAERAAPGAARAGGRGGRAAPGRSPGWPCRRASRCRCWPPPGIVLLAPGWRDALARWLPRWLAEAIAVPAAAQLACTPVVAAISGQVSLVAVAANLAVAPVVGPATVLGLAGGLVGLVAAAARPAARHRRRLVRGLDRDGRRAGRGPAGGRGRAGGPGRWRSRLLTALTVAGRAWRRRRCCADRSRRSTADGVLAAVVLVRWPTPGWPPDGWVLAMCDVGQGDALVLRAGPGVRRGRRRRPRPGAGGRLPAPARASTRCRWWC